MANTPRLIRIVGGVSRPRIMLDTVTVSVAPSGVEGRSGTFMEPRGPGVGVMDSRFRGNDVTVLMNVMPDTVILSKVLSVFELFLPVALSGVEGRSGPFMEPQGSGVGVMDSRFRGNDVAVLMNVMPDTVILSKALRVIELFLSVALSVVEGRSGPFMEPRGPENGVMDSRFRGNDVTVLINVI